MTVPSDTSDTDLAIFQHLANPKRVDFSRPRNKKKGTPGHAPPPAPSRGAARPPYRFAPRPPIMEMEEAPSPPYGHPPESQRREPQGYDPEPQGRGEEPQEHNNRSHADDARGGSPDALHIPVGLFPDEEDQPRYPQSVPPQYPVQDRSPPQRFAYVQSEAPARPPSGRERTSVPRQSRFADRVQEELRQTSPKLFSSNRPTASRVAPQDARPLTMPPLAQPAPKYAAPPPQPYGAQAQMSEDEMRSAHANASFPGDHDDMQRIKQRLLIEVADLEQKGYKFPRRPTLEDTVEEIQFEIDHGNSAMEMKQAVNFIRDGIPLVYNVLEMANNKWGPFLPIQGFTDELLEKMNKDPQRYNYVLERMYRRYWRKGSMTPAMEFVWVFIAPFFLYVARKKLFRGFDKGPGPSATSGGGAAASVSPEPPRQFYSEPMNTGVVPDNNIGSSVRPQPPPSGNIFPPPMMEQPPIPPATVPPIRPNLSSAPAAVPSSGRKKLRPPSHGMFAPTQPALAPQPAFSPQPASAPQPAFSPQPSMAQHQSVPSDDPREPQMPQRTATNLSGVSRLVSPPLPTITALPPPLVAPRRPVSQSQTLSIHVPPTPMKPLTVAEDRSHELPEVSASVNLLAIPEQIPEEEEEGAEAHEDADRDDRRDVEDM